MTGLSRRQMNRIRVDKGLEYSDVVLLGEGLSQWEITLGEGARLQLVLVALAGASSRVDCRLKVSFEGEGANCSLKGLYLAGGESMANFEVEMVHNIPRCTSSQLFKGILAGKAHSSFHGLIRVPSNCVGTEAYQENHNLLLSDDCRAQSLPQLEIYADDVRCSHGATVGRLDADELFYMRSRGIALGEARRLQMVAFVSEVLQDVPEDIAAKALAQLGKFV